MQTAVIAFLSIAVVILTIGMTIITRWYVTLCNEYEESGTCIDELTSDNKILFEDKRDLIRQNEDLLSDNQKLAIAVREMREMIKKLTVQKENQINELESGDNDKILQANAISSKERLPEGHTNVISGMPLTSITNKQSEQWKLQCDTNTFTGDYGIRCYNDGERTYFLSAMGSAYGRTIGDAFRITLQCSTVIYVMLGEFKDDGSDPDFFGHTTHQDGTPLLNCDGEPYTCVLEFIYDADELDPRVGYAGTFTKLDVLGGLYGHGGNIIKIEYLGRKWKP